MKKQLYSDSELVRLMSEKGNLKGFKMLFEQYYSVLVKVLARHTRDPEQIKDWIQEIFAQLWENRENLKIEDIENLKGYIIVIGRNHAIKQLGKKRKVELVFDEALADVEIVDNNLEEGMRRNELFDAYENAMARLPPRTQKAFFLSREKGLPYAKVAEELGTSIKTVEAQISNALTFLRHELISFL